MLNLVSDSSCDLFSGPLSSSAQLTVVPMCLRVGDQEYPDTPDLSIPALLKGLAAHPSSSACPSPAAFAEAFERGSETVCVTISANLSGTYNAAMAARDMVLSEHPEKKIHVVNSCSTAGQMMLLLRKAAALAAENVPFDDLCQQLEAYRTTLRTCFTLENFDNLIKNGRMAPIAGTLLQTLGIRIIADATPEGTIHVAKKVRGEAHTYKAIAQQMAAMKSCTDSHVIICHCQNPEGAERLRETIQAKLSPASIELMNCRGLTSFYAMDKGLIVSF